MKSKTMSTKNGEVNKSRGRLNQGQHSHDVTLTGEVIQCHVIVSKMTTLLANKHDLCLVNKKLDEGQRSEVNCSFGF